MPRVWKWWAVIARGGRALGGRAGGAKVAKRAKQAKRVDGRPAVA